MAIALTATAPEGWLALPVLCVAGYVLVRLAYEVFRADGLGLSRVVLSWVQTVLVPHLRLKVAKSESAPRV
jgi:hypothetical protein